MAVLNAEFGPHVSGASLHYRLLHTSPALLKSEPPKKPSSKIEETVNRLKEKTEKTEEAEVRGTSKSFTNLHLLTVLIKA